jgi:hypothetical protein
VDARRPDLHRSMPSVKSPDGVIVELRAFLPRKGNDVLDSPMGE